MLITPHILAGTAIGLAVGNPAAGFVLGVASHYLLDSVPHVDPGTWHMEKTIAEHGLEARDYATILLDVAAALFGFVALSGAAPIMAAGPIAGAIGGALPDTLVAVALVFPKFPKWKGLKWYHDLIEKFHYTAKPSQWILGVATQLAVIIGSVWFILAR